ncbi:MAG TPA: alpha/beta hydrolase [Steroidobacteraceae bacterium]|jgi:pimeloyl-ACP methyl ester carboxylesterase
MSARASVSGRPTHAADLFATVNGIRLRFRDEGRGPVVLLVHGWTLDLEMWDPQVSALRDAFRLIRLDRRGHGLSSGIPAPERDSEDLAALCQHLRLTRIALLGMSQGARAVLGFAASAPGQVHALILDGPPPLDSDSDPEVPLDQYETLVRTHGIEAFRHEWARHALMQLRTRNPEARALLAAIIARYPGNDLRHPVSRTGPAARVRLGSLTIPTLVLSGEYDLANRKRAAWQLSARLSGAELVEIPGAGHLPNLDRPDAYSKLCREFLTHHFSRDTF